MEPRLLSHPARLAGTSLLRLQSDERLVDLARAGHEQAFATIVNRHGPALQRYCARLLGPERAEDAVQQAFINAHNAMTRHDDTRELQIRPWLYRIAHNVSLNVLRSRHDDAELTDAIPSAERVEDTVIGRDQLARTLAAVAALPMHQRDALVLRELEGRSHDEIATTLGVSPGAARQHVFRARAAMRTGVTAITPNVLMIRLLESGAGAASGGVPEIAAGAGLGLGAVGTKIAVGLLAAGAIVGGAVGTGVVPMPHILRHHHARSHESAAAAGLVGEATAADTAGAGPAATIGHNAPSGDQRRGRGKRGLGALPLGGRQAHGDHSGSGGAGHPGSGSGDHSGSGSGDHSGSSGGDHSGSSSGDGSDSGSSSPPSVLDRVTTTSDGGGDSGSSGSDGSGDSSRSGATSPSTTTTTGD